ncbi:MAG: type II toxin-antitoxin system VapC family toxin [Acidimicrobiales bacterium]
MRLLLDSHVLLWWLEDNPSLGVESRAAIADADEVFVSAVSPWELGIKQALGKLTMPGDLAEAAEAAGFAPLTISLAHATTAPALPAHHRDPFDRMLVAQAQLEALTLVSADRQLAPYEVDLLDARR